MSVKVTFDTTDPHALARLEKARPYIERIAADVEQFVHRARMHRLLYGLCLVCGDAHDFTEHSADDCADAVSKR